MTIKHLTLTSIFAILASCGTTQTVAKNTTMGDTTQNSVDWAGTYYGVTPDENSKGTETELTLNNNSTYVLKTNKFGDVSTLKKNSGNFVWEGNNIKLQGISESSTPAHFWVQENRILQLDNKGKVITGEKANQYALEKTGNLEVENKKWQLIELLGKPVSGTADSHYVIFNSEKGTINSKAGCNIMNFGYQIRNQFRLVVKPGISTQMACPDQNTEQEFAKAISTADNLSVNGENLTLNKGRMAPLAKFKLVK